MVGFFFDPVFRRGERPVMARSTLTVFFENPFWVGVYERVDGDRYEVCKITFGAETKDYEVYDFQAEQYLVGKTEIICLI